MSDRTQRAAERLLARLAPSYAPRIVRLDAVERERQRLMALIGEPELDERHRAEVIQLRADAVAQHNHGAQLFAEAERLRAELVDTKAILDGSGAEVGRLRGLLAEVLPYAIAGAEALYYFEPYGDAEGAEQRTLCEGADAMLTRLRGEIRTEVEGR